MDNVRLAKFILILLVLLFLVWPEFFRRFEDGNETEIDNEGFKPWWVGISGLALLVQTWFWPGSENTPTLLALGVFVISSLSYTIYKWSANEQGKECGIIIPKSNYFNSGDYHWYRTIYVSTLIILVSLLQFKVDDPNFRQIFGHTFSKENSQIFLFLLPLLLPMMTEFFTWVTNRFPGPETNPESLLLNFIKGGAKEEWEDGDGDEDGVLTDLDLGTGIRSAMPVLFYSGLMCFSWWGVMGQMGFNTTSWPIYIILTFMVFFSFIMRSTFIQKCSLDQNINETDKTDPGLGGFEKIYCSIEKYGGIQVLLNICLMVIIIYHVNNPHYKLLFSVIMCLGVWALSTTYMLSDLKSE